MPDVTVSFTDAQWARIVAASAYIRKDGVVDTAFLAERWKKKIETAVVEYEKSQKTTDAWE